VRDELYPNGIGDLAITDAQLAAMYSKKYVVVVGELDTDPDSYDLKHNEFTDAQGLNRYERALFYHDYMRKDAASRGVSYNWDLLVVEDVGHPAELVAHATAGAVFEGVTTPADVTFRPTDDSYVDKANPSSNYGTSTNLRIDGGSSPEWAYLKFDLRTMSGTVEAALLKLYISDGSIDRQYVHEVADNSWSESSLTWDNAPAIGAQVGMTTGGEKDGILYIAVTDYINRRAGASASMAIVPAGTDDLAYRSKEAGEFKAELVVLYSNSGSGPGDLNGDKVVNIDDLALVIEHYGQSSGDASWDPRADADGDGAVTIDDLTEVTSNFGKSY
jgi:hypothetical protein